MKSVAVAHIGLYHLKKNIPCQDAVSTYETKEVTAIALADGAGSQRYSGEGASILVETFAKELAEDFQDYWDMEQEKLKETLYQIGMSKLNLAEYPLDEMGSTLLLCACHKDGRCLRLQIGDGVQLVTTVGTREIRSIQTGEQGEYINETVFFTADDAIFHMNVVKSHEIIPYGVTFMSDGLAESMYERQGGIVAEATFLMRDWLVDGDEAEVAEAIRYHMETMFSKKTKDDMSIAMVIVGEA